MLKSMLLILTTLALSGCVAVWGRAYEVEFQSADAVILKYDGPYIERIDVVKVGQESCAKYGKDAAVKSEETSMWNITTISFDCAARK